jgi:hypothetical protein
VIALWGFAGLLRMALRSSLLSSRARNWLGNTCLIGFALGSPTGSARSCESPASSDRYERTFQRAMAIALLAQFVCILSSLLLSPNVIPLSFTRF